MKTTDEFVQDVIALDRARFPILYVVTSEERRALHALWDAAHRRGSMFLVWSFTMGWVTHTGDPAPIGGGEADRRDPLAALDTIYALQERNDARQALLVLKDFDPFLEDAGVVRRLRDCDTALRQRRQTIVILSPRLVLPPHLAKAMHVLDFPLPERAVMETLVDGAVEAACEQLSATGRKEDPRPTPEVREEVVRLLSGLTYDEADSIVAKSLVAKTALDPVLVGAEKKAAIRKTEVLEIVSTDDRLADVGGHERLKAWLAEAQASFSDEARAFGVEPIRGALYAGVPGTAKSLIIKATANDWRLPLVRADIGRLMGSLVGESESRVREMTRIAEAAAPCLTGDTRVVLGDGREVMLATLFSEFTGAFTVCAVDQNLQVVTTQCNAVTRRWPDTLYRITTTTGALKATGNHLHLCLRHGVPTWVRTDALSTSDVMAVPVKLPTPDTPPSIYGYLPANTRLYFQDALAHLRPGVLTRRALRDRTRRAAQGRPFLYLHEAARYPAPASLQAARLGRGGTATSSLPCLPATVDDRLGYLLGLLASDGKVTRAGTIRFASTCPDLVTAFEEIVRSLFGLSARRYLGQPPTSPPPLKGLSSTPVWAPCWYVAVGNKLAALLLQRVQDTLLAMPRSVLAAWLSGYLDGDGSIGIHPGAEKIIFCTNVPRMAELIQGVLRRLGCLPPVARNVRLELTGIAAVLQLAPLLTLRHPEKARRLALIAACHRRGASRRDQVPVGSLLRSARGAAGLSTTVFTASSSLIHRWETGEGRVPRTRLSELVADFARRGADPPRSLERLSQADVAWVPVLDVVPIPSEPVFDLCCEPPHTFIANGFVTHNCLLWFDEVEKGIGGVASSAHSDAGTTARVFGHLLTWMQETRAGAVILATCNDVTMLPPEFLRRFDAVWFFDVPHDAERRQIWTIHLRKRGRDPSTFNLEQLAEGSDRYTGAEIEKAVKQALRHAFLDGRRAVCETDLLGILRSAEPLVVSHAERIEQAKKALGGLAQPTSAPATASSKAKAASRAARAIDLG